MEGIKFLSNKRDEDIIKELTESDLPIYIFGCGNYGAALNEYLNDKNIKVDAFIVDDVFFSCDRYEDVPVYKLSDVEQDNKCMNLVIGVSDFNLGFLKAKRIKNARNVYCLSNPYLYLQKYNIDKNYVEKYYKDFEWTYRILEDDLSRNIMVGYLNTRSNKDYSFLMPYNGCKTYFNKEIVNLSENECYVDCGAFIGDSIETFIKSVNGKYQKIYAIEPDKINYEIMKRMTAERDWKDICLINKGVWKEETEIGFEKEGKQELSVIVRKRCGQKTIFVDSLDNILKTEKVTLIKLSVQGAEEEAILGAKNILRIWEPTLAITIFMRPDSLIKIPRAIKKINPKYKLFLRCEEPFFAKVILYAKINIKENL